MRLNSTPSTRNNVLNVDTHNMWLRYSISRGATLTKARYGIFCNWLAPKNLRVKRTWLAKKNALLRPLEMDIPLGKSGLS